MPTPSPIADEVSLRDALVLAAAGVCASDPGWAGVAAVCPDLVDDGLRRGQSPAGITALFAAMAPGFEGPHLLCRHEDHPHCGWSSWHIARAVATAGALSGMDWVGAAVCLRAGMSVPEIREYLSSGRDLEPVLLLAALSG